MGWVVRLALLFLVACSTPSKPCAPIYVATPELPRVITPCLSVPPPERPDQDPDPGLDRAIRLDYLDRLDRWVRLYAWPACKEIR